MLGGWSPGQGVLSAQSADLNASIWAAAEEKKEEKKEEEEEEEDEVGGAVQQCFLQLWYRLCGWYLSKLAVLVASACPEHLTWPV